MDRMISNYLLEMSAALFWIKGKDGVPETQRQRWLHDHLREFRGFAYAFAPLRRDLAGT
jgi:hypothetical protein